MIFSSKIYRLLQKVEPSLREVLIAILEEMEQQRQQWEQSVTRKEFTEFARMTEENFKKVWEAIHELTEAQRRTEQRVEELAEAQKKTEDRLDRLEKTVERLVEAQRRTEQKVEELAEAQRRTEQRVEELAEAQKRTEREIQRLTGELAMVKDRLEGISHSVGYSLENKSYKVLPELLKRDMGIEVTTPLVRKYLTLEKGKTFQANIYGRGRMDGEEVIILGECKVRPSKREVRRFLSRVRQVEEKEGKKVIALIVAHDFLPEMEEYLRSLGIKYYWSYELE